MMKKTVLVTMSAFCIFLLAVGPLFAQPMSKKAQCQTKSGKTICKLQIAPPQKGAGGGHPGSQTIGSQGCTWRCTMEANGYETCETSGAGCQNKFPVHWEAMGITR